MIALSYEGHKARVARLFHEGKSRNEIARITKRSPKRITAALRELGLKEPPKPVERHPPPPAFPGVTQIPDDVADVIAKGEHLLTADHIERANAAIEKAKAELRANRVVPNGDYEPRYYEPVSVIIGRPGGIKSGE